MTREVRFQLRLDEDTRVALARLALADERSASAQLRHMIRQEAQKRGLWVPSAPQAVSVRTGAASRPPI
jgi:hypothetical protein